MLRRAPRQPRVRRHGWARGACLALACAGLLAGGVSACPADVPTDGMAGRSATAEFGNLPLAGALSGAQSGAVPDGGARHEGWADQADRLRLHAGYFQETAEYGHGIMGPFQDGKGLTIRVSRDGAADAAPCPIAVVLPEGQVFEGIAPILADVDLDGRPEIITTVSSVTQGARVTIYDRDGGQMASTPYIGRRNRWLALVGAADLDGDGRVEIAYVDRPHLAKVLRVWRYDAGALVEVAAAAGMSNHQIGWAYITGGLRDCGRGPEMILASGDWRQLLAVTYEGGLTARSLGRYSVAAVERAMGCR